MSCLDKAIRAWGGEAPEWVAVLAEECDRSTQSATAKQIGYSTGAVCAVLANKYKADVTAIERAVRGVLMKAEVACPVVGPLAMDVCMRHQKAPFSAHNPQRIQFYKACRSGCPHSRLGETNAKR